MHKHARLGLKSDTTTALVYTRQNLSLYPKRQTRIDTQAFILSKDTNTVLVCAWQKLSLYPLNLCSDKNTRLLPGKPTNKG